VVHSKFLAAQFLSLGLISSPVMAQQAAEAEHVKVRLEPYVWGRTLNGSTILGTISAPVHVTPKDFIVGFQIGGMGNVKIAQHDRFIYADATFVDYDNRSFWPFFGQPLRAKIRYFDFGIGVIKSVRLNDRFVLTLSPQIGV
jgi:hypothetical protein